MPQNWNFEEPSDQGNDDIEHHFNEDEDSDSEAIENANKDPIEAIESDVYQDEILYNPKIMSGDVKAFIKEYLDEGDVHKSKLSIMLYGSQYSSGDGNPENFMDLIDEIVADEELSDERIRAAYITGIDETIEPQGIPHYSSKQNFVEDLAELVKHEEFERFAPATQEQSSREEQLEYIAEKLYDEGEEEEILGIPHFTYTIDEGVDMIDYKPEERDSVDREREVFEEKVDLNHCYADGFIGRSSKDRKHDVSVEITMRASNVQKYAET